MKQDNYWVGYEQGYFEAQHYAVHGRRNSHTIGAMIGRMVVFLIVAIAGIIIHLLFLIGKVLCYLLKRGIQ